MRARMASPQRSKAKSLAVGKALWPGKGLRDRVRDHLGHAGCSPALLALAGAAVAIAPVDVGLHLDALALFIAPVLLDAAYDTSLRDLKRHWAPVASLALIAV